MNSAVTATEVEPRMERKTHPTGIWHLFRQMLMPLASLRLTVFLFALSIFLIFVGTLAQIDYGLYTVLHKYFRALYVWIPFQLFVQFGQIFLGLPKSWEATGSFPFPGGWLLGGLLLVNLLAAHLVRFRVSWKRLGILLIHSGLVVMMLGEFVTGVFATEGKMVIQNGESAGFVEIHNSTELAVTVPVSPEEVEVVSIPENLLRKRGLIQIESLPFDIDVRQFMLNSAFKEARPGMDNPATTGFGENWIAVSQPEVSGVSQGEDVASAYITLKDKKTGQPIDTLLVSRWLNYRPDIPPRLQQVKVNGVTYELSLRSKRIYKPYTVQLLEFRHDRYPGTDIPKNYSSRVRVTDPAQDEDREVLISMNSPLRYGGDTLYQSGVLPAGRGTILQVVRNPGWEMPYVSCFMVASGMIIHFVLHLIGFLRRRVMA